MNIHFKSEKQDWTTPKDFYDRQNKRFKFVLDAACESYNCLCDDGFYFDKGINALEESWVRDGFVWCNPPYGRDIKNFVAKAYEEWKKGAKIVMLIPARTDTSYWHEYIFNKADITFLRGRLKFGNSKNPAPFRLR